MKNEISVQTLLECIREFDEAGEDQIKQEKIKLKHERLGVDKVIAKQAAVYHQFWEIWGKIKVFEAYYWIDEDSKDLEEKDGEFPPNAFPFANKQTLEDKALIAWHLLNILDNDQDPMLTREQARFLWDRARKNDEDNA